MTISSAQGVKAAHVKNLVFKNVIVTPRTGPVFELTDARDVLIANGRAPARTAVFLKAAGKDTHSIRLEATDLSAAQQKVVLADGVAADAVSIR